MTKLRLLIDASAGFNQGAGIGRYAREMLRASLTQLDNEFDLRIWYAPDGGRIPAFAQEALESIPADLHANVHRSRLGRRRIDQLSRLPINVSSRLLAGPGDLAYSPDFTLPGTRSKGGLVTVHDLAFEIIPEAYPPGLLRYLQQVVPRNIRTADRVAVVSRTTRIDVVERYNVPPDRVAVIPNAADDRFFAGIPLQRMRRIELGLPEDYVLTVGTIEPRKNYLSLLTAQKQAFATTKRPLVIVGRSGWQNSAEMKLIAELADSGAAIPLLNASDVDLPGLYAGATAVVYVPLYEGFGLPVLESMASGTPVITSDIPSVREVAAGFATIVPPRDIDGLTDAIQAVQPASVEHRRELQATARTYRWDDSGRILVDTLEQMSRA